MFPIRNQRVETYNDWRIFELESQLLDVFPGRKVSCGFQSRLVTMRAFLLLRRPVMSDE